jgi:hypothetical protein
MDGSARTGTEAPGFLGLGLVRVYSELEERELKRLGTSLARALAERSGVSPGCSYDRRFKPRVAFKSPRFDASRDYSIAVLPFVNESARRRAGEIVALEFTRQLAAVPRLRVIEPGVVRERLIGRRVIMEGGVSVDTARTILDSVHADVVIAGYVRELDDTGPVIDFTVLALDREQGRIMWESTSHSSGTDGVWFFEAGKIATSGALLCRMAHDTVTAVAAGAGK